MGASLIAAAVLTAGAFYAVPQVMPNLLTEVAETDTVQSVTADATSASVTVPAGWAYYHVWGDPGELVVRSPDGRLSTTVSLSTLPAAEALDDARRVAGGGEPLGAVSREELASGLEVFHTGDDDTGAFLAALGGESSPSVVFDARGPAGGIDAYRSVLSGLLESARVGS